MVYVHLINIATYQIEMLIAYLYFSDVLTKRFRTSIVFIYGILIYLILGTLNIYFCNNITINVLCFTAANILYAQLCFKTQLKKAFFHSIILTAIMTITEFMSVYLISCLFNVKTSLYRSDFEIYILNLAISKILYTIVCKFLTKVLPENKSKSKVPIYLFIYPFCCLLSLLLFRKISEEYTLSFELKEMISIFSFISLIAIIVTYFMYSDTIKKDNELFWLKQEFNKTESDKTYYKLLELKNEEMHIFVHDTKNHLATIQALANSPFVDEYVDKINNDLIKCTPKCNTNNKIMDLVLEKYSDLCKINHIELSTIIKTANLNFMNEMDLSSFLNNILSNAYEAAIDSTEKRIELSINKIQGFDVLTCTNSCDKKPIIQDNILLTSKKDKTIHGYGIKSIKKIVKKYHGNYEWNYDSKEKEFTTTVVFKE